MLSKSTCRSQVSRAESAATQHNCSLYIIPVHGFPMFFMPTHALVSRERT